MVPPTITRLTLGLPNGSALSRLLRIFSRNSSFRPLASMSARRFSATSATIASTRALYVVVGQPPAAEERPERAQRPHARPAPDAGVDPRAVEVQEDRLRGGRVSSAGR